MSKKRARAELRAHEKVKSQERAKKAAVWANKCKLITPVMKQLKKTKQKVPTFKQIQKFLKQKFKLRKTDADKITVIFRIVRISFILCILRKRM